MDKATKKVIESVEALPRQAITAWEDSQKIEFPAEYKSARNIVVCGMGGSALPTHVIQSAVVSRIPLVLVRGYDIPAWVSKTTLVVLSSYSGGTEETLSCAEQAAARGALMTGITTGGKLAEKLAHHGHPGYVFEPKHNPSKQPRLGLGYMIFGLLGILDKLGLVGAVGGSLNAQVREAVEFARGAEQRINDDAEKLAKAVLLHGLLVFAADHLEGNAHVFANQTNETAKTFAAWFALPEANHHLLEGLKRPKAQLAGIFLESKHYSSRMKKRFELTRQIVEKNGYPAHVYKPQKGSLIGEALECLMFSSLVTLKLAIVYNENPTAIPWVDFFKEELEKEKGG